MKKFSTFTLITGLIFIGVGIFFLFYPDNALKTVIKIAAILAIVKGIFDLLRFFRLNSQTGKKDYGLIFSGVFNFSARDYSILQYNNRYFNYGHSVRNLVLL